MLDRQNHRLNEAELRTFLDRLFPQGFAGGDVLAEIAPCSWEQSPLLECFYPPVEQRYEEALRLYRNIEVLRRARRARDSNALRDERDASEPTLGQVPATYSVSESAVAELTAQKRRVEMARVRAAIEEMNARARDEAMDRQTPAAVRAYRHVYGRDPRGWPPA